MRLLLALSVIVVAFALHVNAKSIDARKLKALLAALQKAAGPHPPGPGPHRGPGPRPHGPGRHSGPHGPGETPDEEGSQEGETPGEEAAEAVEPGPTRELIDHARFLKDKCGIDVAEQFKAATPVAASEIKSALAGVKDHAMGVLSNLEGHEGKLVEIGALLAASGTTVPDLVNAHGQLLDQFNSTFSDANQEAMCIFGRIVSIRIRMGIFGSTGFVGTGTCFATASTLYRFMKSNNFDPETAKSKIDIAFVKEVGKDIISDIKCIVNDLRDFVDALTQADTLPATTPARHVAVMLDAVVSFAMTLGRESQRLVQVVRGLVRMIPVATDQQTPAATKDLLHHLLEADSKTDLGKLMDILKIAMKLKQRR